MCSKPDNTNQLEPNSHVIPSSAVCSQPWWHGVGYSVARPGILGESASKSSVDRPGIDMETKTSLSQGDGDHEGEDVSKEVPISSMPQTVAGTDGYYGPQNQHMQQVASTMAPSGSEYITTHPQLELVGHSIACAPYPYSDPYYGGLMTAYGTQALVNSHLIGMHHSRMPLPLQMAEEPVYVNAKQYHGIIRRRESRAKAELDKKLIKVRKPYLHESRHQHAMRRARGCGGRFLNTKKLQEGENSNPEKGMDCGAESTTQSRGPSGSGTNGRLEVKGFIRQDMHEQLMHGNRDGNGNGSYQHHQGFRMSAYHSLPSERGEEGDCSGQQRGSISVSQARHRALAIQ